MGHHLLFLVEAEHSGKEDSRSPGASEFIFSSRLSTPELNEIEKEMVEAARTNFEQSLTEPAVPALTEAEWLERVAFPLRMSEEGDLFFGDSPEDPR
jgi:hypothetical protein